MSPKWRARLALVAIYAASAALTFGLGDDATFNGLPFALQALVFVAAIITGVATALIVFGGLAALLFKATS